MAERPCGKKLTAKISSEATACNRQQIASYETTVAILAEMVKSFLASQQSVEKMSKVSNITFLRVSVLLQREDEGWADFELTAELLGTRDFKRIA